MKTSAYKYAISGLMLIAAILSGMLILQVRENRLLRLDLRHVRDVLVRYDAERERALAADIPGTLEHLKRFDVDAPADEMGDRFLRDILVQRRRQITRDLIEDLRRKTGQDYGDTAEEWIRGLKDVRGECF